MIENAGNLGARENDQRGVQVLDGDTGKRILDWHDAPFAVTKRPP